MTHEEMCETFKKAYPKLVPSDFYFECDIGWYKLIEEFLELATQILATKDSGLQHEFYVSQIKEKFGLIRIYVSEYDDDINKLINEIELKSETICENCGKSGTLRKRGWRKVRCDSCEEQFYEQYAKK